MVQNLPMLFMHSPLPSVGQLVNYSAASCVFKLVKYYNSNDDKNDEVELSHNIIEVQMCVLLVELIYQFSKFDLQHIFLMSIETKDICLTTSDCIFRMATTFRIVSFHLETHVVLSESVA